MWVLVVTGGGVDTGSTSSGLHVSPIYGTGRNAAYVQLDYKGAISEGSTTSLGSRNVLNTHWLDLDLPQTSMTPWKLYRVTDANGAFTRKIIDRRSGAPTASASLVIQYLQNPYRDDVYGKLVNISRQAFNNGFFAPTEQVAQHYPKQPFVLGAWISEEKAASVKTISAPGIVRQLAQAWGLAGEVGKEDPTKREVSTTRRKSLSDRPRPGEVGATPAPATYEDELNPISTYGRPPAYEKVWGDKTWRYGHWDFSYKEWKKKRRYGDKLVRIGISTLPVAPQSIQVSTQPAQNNQASLRESTSTPGNYWRAPRFITLTIELPSKVDRTHPQWESFPKKTVDGVEVADYDPVEELRKLVAQSRVAPFLPISWGDREGDNPHLPDIDAIALNQLIISTSQGIPGAYQVTLVGMEFNWRHYLKDDDKIRFEEYFVWPIYERWIEAILEEQMIRTSHSGKIQISIPNEEALISAAEMYKQKVGPASGGSLLRQESSLEQASQNVLRSTTTAQWLGITTQVSSATNREELTQVINGASSISMLDVTVDDATFSGDFRPLHLFRLGDLKWALQDKDFRKALLKNVSIAYDPADILMGETQLRVDVSGQRLEPQEFLQLENSALENLYFGWEGRDSQRYEKKRNIQKALATLHNEKKKKIEESKTSRGQIKEIRKAVNAGNVLSNESFRENIMLPGIIVEGIQIILTNHLSIQEAEGDMLPVIQFWGSPDIQTTLTVRSKTGLEGLEYAYEKSRKFQASYGSQIADRTGLEPGFWHIKERLCSALGLEWALPAGLDRGTTPQLPRGEEGTLFLNLFIPSPASPLAAGKQFQAELPQEMDRGKSWSEFLKFTGDMNRSTKGFKELVLKEIELEFRLKVIPLYPDLYLPTWDTVQKWISELKELYPELVLSPPQDKYLFVDPDFYIKSKDPWTDKDFYGIKEILSKIDQGIADVTLTSRSGKAGKIHIDNSQDPSPSLSGEDGEVDSKALSKPFMERVISTLGHVPTDNQMKGETIVSENPFQDPGTYPLKDAVRGAFHDLVFQTPLNRLLSAFPTMLILFYRDGKWIGYKRMWDQFYGRLPIRHLKVSKSMYRPDDIAIIGLGADALGMASRDLSQSVDLPGVMSEGVNLTKSQGERARDAIQKKGMIFGVGEAAHIVYGEWRASMGQASSMGANNPQNLSALAQRWEDLSNALVISPGTRVHIKMGYGSTLTRIPSVFSGSIAEVQMGDNGMDIVASSDGYEMTRSLYLARVANKESGDEIDEAKAEWVKMFPRKWIMDTLGSYNSGPLQRFANVFGIGAGNPADTAGITGDTVNYTTSDGESLGQVPVARPVNASTSEVGKTIEKVANPIFLLDQTYGIEHFGNPIPVFDSRKNQTYTKSWLELGKYNFSSASEQGQNVFSSVRSGITEEDDLTTLADSLGLDVDIGNGGQHEDLAVGLFSSLADSINNLSISRDILQSDPEYTEAWLSDVEVVLVPVLETITITLPENLQKYRGLSREKVHTTLREVNFWGANESRAIKNSLRKVIKKLSDREKAVLIEKILRDSSQNGGKRSGGGEFAERVLNKLDDILKKPENQKLYDKVRAQTEAQNASDEAIRETIREVIWERTGLDSNAIQSDNRSVSGSKWRTPDNPYGEHSIRLNIYDKSFWDITTDLAKLYPGFVASTCPFGTTRSTFFWGKPHYPLSYTYGAENLQTINGHQRWLRDTDASNPQSVREKAASGVNGATVAELIKTFSQCHLAHNAWGLLKNRIELDQSGVFNRAVAYWQDDTGTLRQTGKNAWWSGEQVLIAQVDADIIPEDQREMRVVVPFPFSFWTNLPGDQYSGGRGDAIATEYTKRYVFETLAESIRTMYSGHLLMMGNGNIKPWDYVQLNDDWNSMAGLCTVREVTHHAEIGVGFVTDVRPGAISWSSKSDNMRAAVGISIVSQIISANVSSFSALQDIMQTNRRSVMVLLQQCIETADYYRDQRDIGNSMTRSSMEEFSKSMRAEVKKLKTGGVDDVKKSITTSLGRMEITKGTPGPWGPNYQSKGVEGLIGRFLGESLGPTIGVDNEVYVSLSGTYSKLLVTKAADEAGGQAMLLTGPYGTSASSENKAAVARIKEAAEAGLKWDDYIYEVKPESKDPIKEGLDKFGKKGLVQRGLAAGGRLVYGMIKFNYGLAKVPIALLLQGKSIDALIESKEHAVYTMFLLREGKEYQTGLSGHRGAIVGEAGSAMDELVSHVGGNELFRWYFNLDG